MGPKALDPKPFIVHAISSARGPPKELSMGLKCRTIGKFIKGSAFDVTDDWTSGSQAHRLLKELLDWARGVLCCRHCCGRCLNIVWIGCFVLQKFNIRMALM